MSVLVIPRAAVNQSQHRARIESGAFLPDSFFASQGRMSAEVNGEIMLSHPDENELTRLLNTHTVFEGMDWTRRDGAIYLLPHGVETDILRRDAGVLRPALEETREDEAETLQPPHGIVPAIRDYTPLQVAEPDERYQVKIASMFNAEITALARTICTMQKEFDGLFSNLIKLKRKIMLALTPLNDNPIISQLIESIITTRRHAKVERAFICNDLITIVTKQIISVPVSGSRRLVGKMMIVLPIQMFVGESPVVSGVRIYNLTHVINDGGRVWQAPHVTEDGASCFGSTMQLIFDAIVAKDVSLVASSVIQFLEQPNIGDPYGRCATLLPVVMETNEG